MIRWFQGFLAVVLLTFMAFVPGQANAQLSAQALQELFRSQLPGGAMATGGPKPQPSRAVDPQPLSSPIGLQPERICKFEETPQEGEQIQERPASRQMPPVRTDVFGAVVPTYDSNQLQQQQQQAVKLYRPNQFERYVKSVSGQELCRFGFQTVFGGSAFFEPPPLATPPEDYVLGLGDEVFIRLWGSIEQDYSAILDRSGNVVIPKVGPVKLAGIRYGQAPQVLRAAVRKMFSDFDVSLTLGQLRGIRVFITGYADRPGAVTVSNFSSLSSVVIAAGGPAAAGSFRNIELRRNGQVIARFDLYDLLLKGDKSADRPLLSEDVIHFGPIGPQVAIFGGVNKPAVFEMKGGESVSDLVRMAGNLAPGSTINNILRLPILEREKGFQLVKPDQVLSTSLADGDVVKVQDNSMVLVPNDRMLKRVVLQGQVRKPGEYFLPPDATLAQAIEIAGGKAPGAFLYGLKLTRKSVLEEQKVLLRRILRELDRDLVSQSAMRPLNQEEAAALTARLEIGRTMIARLQSFEPEGRLALPIFPGTREVPSVKLEDGDVITIPAIPGSVGVFGSVVSAGSFLYDPTKELSDYLELAGGASKGGDLGQVFVIQANGQAKRDDRSWIPFWGAKSVLAMGLNPGDTIVVPEKMDKTTFTRELVQFTQILYQLGLGAAGIKILRD